MNRNSRKMELVGTTKGTVAFRRDKNRRDTPMAQVSLSEADFWKLYASSFDEEFGYLLQPTGWVYRKGGTRNLPLTHAAISRES